MVGVLTQKNKNICTQYEKDRFIIKQRLELVELRVDERGKIDSWFLISPIKFFLTSIYTT